MDDPGETRYIVYLHFCSNDLHGTQDSMNSEILRFEGKFRDSTSSRIGFCSTSLYRILGNFRCSWDDLIRLRLYSPNSARDSDWWATTREISTKTQQQSWLPRTMVPTDLRV